MPTSEHFYDDDDESGSRPRYESYDGSGYGSPISSRTSSDQFPSVPTTATKPPQTQVNGHYDDFDFSPSFGDSKREPASQPTVNGINGQNFDDFRFSPSLEEKHASHHMSLNTKVRDNDQDAVGKHLLFETALLDTQTYEVTDIHEVDELKKELSRLEQRIEASKRKLALESKVKDAAQNLQRLLSSGKKDGRPDTPQSPESPRKRSSLLGNKRPGSSGSQSAQTLHQAEDELAQSIKIVDELNEQIKMLLERRLVVERKLLRHTAAVLAEQASLPPESRTTALANGHNAYDHDEVHFEGSDEFDGIRDILRGFPAPGGKQDLDKIKKDHEQQILGMQQRLEHLNSQLRNIITEASRTRGKDPTPEPQFTRSDDVHEHIGNTFTVVQSNMRALEQEQEENKIHFGQIQNSSYLTRNAVEEQLEGLNAQLYNAMHLSPHKEALEQLREPPQVTGHGYQHQLQYLEESLFTMENLLKEHNNQLLLAKQASTSVQEAHERSTQGIEDAQARAATHAQKAGEYETVLSGLWEIVAADGSSRGSTDESSGDRSPVTPLREDFSLQAFSSRIQHLHHVATGAREQQDILRRQIQQQRDLNGKADMESQADLEQAQARYDQLASEYNNMQDELAKAMVGQQAAEREATDRNTEMMNVMNELEQLKRAVDETQARQKEVDSRHAQITGEREEAVQRCNDLQVEMENMESEVVRLTTELTIAKADLEGAYGTRKERQKEAGVSAEEMDALQKLRDQEIADLKKTQEQHVETLRREASDRAKLLEQELTDMTNEFQEMTRESLELEKERSQLEGLIDGLRDRCDQLEAQLNDEKMKWMGIKSPGGMDPTAPRETTSVMVLRQEFKKMMREARAEGVRLLRAEQEAHRKLEAELRKVRQSQSPLGRHVQNANAAAAPTTNGLSPSVNHNRTLSPASAMAATQSGG